MGSCLQCLVTAGPTYEPLDDVRRLTNFSTGRLGTRLAEHLSAAGYGVDLLLGELATWRPARLDPARVERFSSTEDLGGRLAARAGRFAAVFHTAAVSDFRFGAVRRSDGSEVRSGKIATEGGGLLAELVPTPKLLARFREWWPEGRLVGWKYEVDGDRESALDAGRRQIRSNSTDACVVNGPAHGPGFSVLMASGHVEECSDDTVLFEVLIAVLAGGTGAREAVGVGS